MLTRVSLSERHEIGDLSHTFFGEKARDEDIGFKAVSEPGYSARDSSSSKLVKNRGG